MSLECWRCFHCDEVFGDRDSARDHFGHTEHDTPACQMDVKHVRWLEEQQRRACDEDTEALRAISRLAGEHETLRRRAEEEGYARGLADAKKHPAELGLTERIELSDADVRALTGCEAAALDRAMRRSVKFVGAVARPLAEYHEDMGPVTWWSFPVNEPAWIGSPLDTDWSLHSAHLTHFTPHPDVPQDPAA